MRRIHVQNISVISIAATIILGLACVAIFMQGRVQFETLQQAAETYISCENDAKQLQSGSDYLTEQVRMVVMTSDLRYTIEEKTSAINEQLARAEDGMPKVSLSVGVAFADRPNPGESLFKDADQALYYTKEHGRNGCTFYGDKGTGAGADTQGELPGQRLHRGPVRPHEGRILQRAGLGRLRDVQGGPGGLHSSLEHASEAG